MSPRCVGCGTETETSFGVRNRATGDFIGCSLAWVIRLCEGCAKKEASWWNFGPGRYEASPDVR